MKVTRQQARIAATAWLEDAGAQRTKPGNDEEICLSLAAIYMVESMWPLRIAA